MQSTDSWLEPAFLLSFLPKAKRDNDGGKGLQGSFKEGGWLYLNLVVCKTLQCNCKHRSDCYAADTEVFLEPQVVNSLLSIWSMGEVLLLLNICVSRRRASAQPLQYFDKHWPWCSPPAHKDIWPLLENFLHFCKNDWATCLFSGTVCVHGTIHSQWSWVEGQLGCWIALYTAEKAPVEIKHLAGSSVWLQQANCGIGLCYSNREVCMPHWQSHPTDLLFESTHVLERPELHLFLLFPSLPQKLTPRKCFHLAT